MTCDSNDRNCRYNIKKIIEYPHLRKTMSFGHTECMLCGDAQSDGLSTPHTFSGNLIWVLWSIRNCWYEKRNIQWWYSTHFSHLFAELFTHSIVIKHPPFSLSDRSEQNKQQGIEKKVSLFVMISFKRYTTDSKCNMIKRKCFEL